MSGYVLFQMLEPFRQMLIERHKFYVDQACTRLLSQFNDIEGEANKAAKEWLKRASHRFDPDRDDEGAIYEAANDEGVAFYQLLQDMYRDVRLSVVAGMFHEWDKQLRDWMVREIRHWHHGDEVRAKIWSQDFGGIVDLFSFLGWDIRNRPYYSMLDTCRLVVNVYKHGDGKSFQDLKQRHPEYLNNPLKAIGGELVGMSFTDFADLTVTEAQIEGFSDAIISFWRDVPNNIHDDSDLDPPKWFENAWRKDQAVSVNQSKRSQSK